MHIDDILKEIAKLSTPEAQKLVQELLGLTGWKALKDIKHPITKEVL